VVIRGKPSAKLAEKLENDEKSRITAQVKKLGPKGLKKAEKTLEEAKLEHERPIPTDVLTSFPVPDVKSISWLQVQSLQERGRGRHRSMKEDLKSDLAKHIRSDGPDLPFFVQYDHVQV
jgi:Zn-dependent M16 (insulinase) family peptidase